MLILLSPPQRGEIGLASSTPPATRQLPGVRWPFVVPPARRIRLRRTGRSPPRKGGRWAPRHRCCKPPTSAIGGEIAVDAFSPAKGGDRAPCAVVSANRQRLRLAASPCRRYLPPLRGRKQ